MADRISRRALALSLATVALSALWVTAQFGGHHATASVVVLVELAASFVASWSLWRGSRRITGRWRGGFRCASAALWFNTLGSAYWAYLVAVRGETIPAAPTLADSAFLLSMLCALGGVFYFSRLSWLGSMTNLADGIIVAAASFLTAWATVLKPLYDHSAADVFSKINTLLLPSAEVVMITAAVLMAMRAQRNERVVISFLLGALVCLVGGNLVFANQLLGGPYTPGTVVDVTWIAAYAFFALMGSSSRPGDAQGRTAEVFSRLRLAFPYFWAAMAVAAVVWFVVAGRTIDPVLVGTGVVLLLGLLSRQFLALTTNVSLAQDLQRRTQELEMREEELRYIAFHDQLTGVPNRTLFQDRLEHALLRLRRHPDRLIAVLFLDIDKFKGINDKYGHAAGDATLKMVADILTHAVRPSDTVGRFGGDEFGVIVDGDVTERAVKTIVERIAAGLATAEQPPGVCEPITASVGYAMATHLSSADDVVRLADAAMYKNKAARTPQAAKSAR